MTTGAATGGPTAAVCAGDADRGAVHTPLRTSLTRACQAAAAWVKGVAGPDQGTAGAGATADGAFEV